MITVSRVSKTYFPKTFSSNLTHLIFGRVSHTEGEGFKALTNITFKINEGEIVGLIGPNGAGKTTLMKILTGLSQPTSGVVAVGPYRPAELVTDFKKSIAFFSGTQHNLDDGVIIRDSFEEKLKTYDLALMPGNQFASRLINLSKIEAFLDRVPEELSTGQRTLVEVAYSLLHQPTYIFFDEPTLGLDLNATLLLKELIRNLNQKEKATFVITSHDLQNVVDISVRIILINRGRLLVDKPTRQILHEETFDRQIEFTLTDKNGLKNLSPEAILDYPRLTIKTTKSKVGEVIALWLPRLHFNDLRITEPPIEEIFTKLYHVSKIQK